MKQSTFIHGGEHSSRILTIDEITTKSSGLSFIMPMGFCVDTMSSTWAKCNAMMDGTCMNV